jgi:hypothetical protein
LESAIVVTTLNVRGLIPATPRLLIRAATVFLLT